MNICITGANGKLGSKLKSVCFKNDWNVLEHNGRKTGDLLDEVHLKEYFENIPDLDCLICCAGGKKIDGNFLSFQKMINDNLFATHLTCQYALSKMKLRSTILIIGSVDGCFGQSEGVFYASAKAALHIYSRCLAKQLLSKEISVNCLALGTLTSDNIESISESILKFCTYSSINGQVIRIDDAHHTFAC